MNWKIFGIVFLAFAALAWATPICSDAIVNLHLDNNSVDSSPNNFPFTNYGNVTNLTAPECVVGTCQQYGIGDGTWTDGEAPIGNPINGSTWSIWVKPLYQDINNNYRHIFAFLTESADQIAVVWDYTGTRIVWNYWGYIPCATYTALDITQWNQVTVTNTPFLTRIYVNGVIDSICYNYNLNETETYTNLAIAPYSEGIESQMQQLDEFHIWNRTFADNEVLALYNQEVLGLSCDAEPPTPPTPTPAPVSNPTLPQLDILVGGILFAVLLLLFWLGRKSKIFGLFAGMWLLVMGFFLFFYDFNVASGTTSASIVNGTLTLTNQTVTYIPSSVTYAGLPYFLNPFHALAVFFIAMSIYVIYANAMTVHGGGKTER